MAPTLANGKICYLEIPATDLARSVKFYQAAFGWSVRKRGDGSTATCSGSISSRAHHDREPEHSPAI